MAAPGYAAACTDMATTPDTSTALSVSELKYAIEAVTGDAVFCGPPVMPRDYKQQLLAQFPSVEANAEEYATILKHLNFASTQTLTDDEKDQVVNEHNKLSVISLTKTGTGYHFSVRAGKPFTPGDLYEGTISELGAVQITKKTAYAGGCPVCLALHTKIDTPKGPVAVENITPGMKVWTVTKDGVRVSTDVEKVIRTQVPSDQHVVHLMLTDGRELFVSPGHPIGDGRTIGALQAGDLLNGTLVKEATLVPYTSSYTYDLLPAGHTGQYWAKGILIGSTLK